MKKPWCWSWLIYLGIRSWLRVASLARVVMRTVMRRGEKPGGLADCRTCVISNSTASKLSKKEVISSTLQRGSYDTERNSPMTHTCVHTLNTITWRTSIAWWHLQLQCSTSPPHHMCVEVFFTVNIGWDAYKLQDLPGLIHNQWWVEFAQSLQVCAEHPTITNNSCTITYTCRIYVGM